jgi:hypothetical protein
VDLVRDDNVEDARPPLCSRHRRRCALWSRGRHADMLPVHGGVRGGGIRRGDLACAIRSLSQPVKMAGVPVQSLSPGNDLYTSTAGWAVSGGGSSGRLWCCWGISTMGKLDKLAGCVDLLHDQQLPPGTCA